MIRVLILKDLKTGAESHQVKTSKEVKIRDHTDIGTMIIDIVGYTEWLHTQYNLSRVARLPNLKALVRKAKVWMSNRKKLEKA